MTESARKAKHNLFEFKLQLEEVLDRYFDQELKESKHFSKYAQHYIKELRNIAMNKGKRLRGSFVYYTYRLFGGEDLEKIMNVAAAIEVLHAYLLIEDDVMDLAETRRDYPTIHATYRDFHLKNKYKKDPHHFGHSIAINVGLIAAHMAMNMINNSGFDLELIRRVQDRVNRQIITVGHGQIHDILNEVRSDLTEQDIINVLYWKTGVYTYENPIHIGAILSGISDKYLKQLSDYAIPGGVAFQIQDDILGSFGDEGKTGKPNDSDIKEGKQTLLTIKAYEKGTHEDRKILDYVLGKHDATEAEIDQVREIFRRTGSLEYSKNKALELVKEARAAIDKHKDENWREEGTEFLAGIADYMIHREL